MQQTSIFVLPTAILSVGQHGPYDAPQMGAEYDGWVIEVTPGPAWPATGGQVLEMLIEHSDDGGASWHTHAATDFGPTGNWGDPTKATWWCWFGHQEGEALRSAPTDLYRFSLNALRVCSPVLRFYGATV